MNVNRPTGYATWCATGATNLTQPDGTHQNYGWGVGEAPPSSYFNFLQQQYDQWIRYLDAGNSFAYGPGSDGTVVFDGVATGASMGLGGLATGPSGNAYRLVRSLYGAHVGVASGIELQTAGFPIFSAGMCVATGSGIITANSVDTANTSGPGTPSPAAVLGGGCTGGFSGAAVGTFGGAPGLGNTGSLGGAGGPGGLSVATGAGQAGGAGGSAIPPQLSLGSIRTYGPSTFGSLVGGGQVTLLKGGAGGGQGGLTGFAAGAGGGGGGVLAIAARTISLGTNLGVQAKGGPGGSVLVGAAGGGGGGGGGGILLAYQTLSIATGGTLAPSVNCAGGVGGAAGPSGGQTGYSGLAGSIYLIPVA